MEQITNALAWACQIYLAYFFIRSAYRKVTGYQRVTDEFKLWGYPFPEQITFFLIVIWILGATALVVRPWSGFAAIVLLAFMIVAFATLVANREYKRLNEPAKPILLLIFVIFARNNEILSMGAVQS